MCEDPILDRWNRPVRNYAELVFADMPGYRPDKCPPFGSAGHEALRSLNGPGIYEPVRVVEPRPDIHAP